MDPLWELVQEEEFLSLDQACVEQGRMSMDRTKFGTEQQAEKEHWLLGSESHLM